MNDRERELITLTGTIKRKIIQKKDTNGKDYYFTFLEVEGEEKPVFFFDPEDDLISQINEFKEGNIVELRGYFNKRDSFTAKEIIS